MMLFEVLNFSNKERQQSEIKLSHKMIFVFTGLLREGDVLVVLEVPLLVAVLTVRALEDAKGGEDPASSSVALVLSGSTGSVGDDERLGEGLGRRVDDGIGYLACVD